MHAGDVSEIVRRRQRPQVHGGIRIASCPGQCPARTCNRRYLGPAMSWPGRVRREREAWRDRRYFVARSKAMQAVTPCFLRRTCAVVQAILKKYSIYTSYAMHCTTAQLESNLRVVLGTCSLVLHFWPFWPVLGPTTTCEISKSRAPPFLLYCQLLMWLMNHEPMSSCESVS